MALTQKFCFTPESYLSRQSHNPFKSESSKLFSSRVMSWSSPVGVESQEMSSHFEALICKHESMSSQPKFNIFAVFFCFKMAPNKLKNGAQCCFFCKVFTFKWLVKAVSILFLSFTFSYVGNASPTLLQEICLLGSVPSLQRGLALLSLTPKTQLQGPPNWNVKHINQWSFAHF